MSSASPTARNEYVFCTFSKIMGWFALILQFVLLLKQTTLSPALAVLRYFSFFTILSNLLLALYFTFLTFRKSSRWQRFFKRPSVSTAITAYMIFVGLSYSILLRSLWNPHGWQLLADELLHTVMPLLILVYWMGYVKRSNFSWTAFFPWLIYPAVYLAYALLISPIIGLYPYPFVDASTLSYLQIFKNGLALLAFFGFISLILIAIDRYIKRKPSSLA